MSNLTTRVCGMLERIFLNAEKTSLDKIGIVKAPTRDILRQKMNLRSLNQIYQRLLNKNTSSNIKFKNF
jgi:hypothetical protein